jgi:SAM-dependent methyltransferase
LPFPRNFADEYFATNPFNVDISEIDDIDLIVEFRNRYLKEASRVLRNEGSLVISFAGNNRFAKVLDPSFGHKGMLVTDVAELGFETVFPRVPYKPGSPYSILHSALQRAEFGRPDEIEGMIIPEQYMRSLILRLVGR